jgi:hypothetical protein
MIADPFFEGSIKLLLEIPEIETGSRDLIPEIGKLLFVANEQESAALENTLRKARGCIVHYNQIDFVRPEDPVEYSKKLEEDSVTLASTKAGRQ